MARDRANINTGIWSDDEFIDITQSEQWLYFLLMTDPKLSYAGVTDWRPGRLAQRSKDTTRQGIEDAGNRLQAGHYILIDEDTEEVLVRSFMRHDGLLKQPRLGVSMFNAYGAVYSKKIRKVIIHELKKLRDEFPDWKAFGVEQVQELFKNESASISEFVEGFTPPLDEGLTPELTPPVGDGFGAGLGDRFGPGFTPGFGSNRSQADPLATSTATSTSTSSKEDGCGKKKDNNQETLEDEADRFEEFWEAYPKRSPHSNPKKPALNKFKKITKTVDPQVLIDAANAYAKVMQGTEPKYIAQAQTWLNQQRWEDEYAVQETEESHWDKLMNWNEQS